MGLPQEIRVEDFANRILYQNRLYIAGVCLFVIVWNVLAYDTAIISLLLRFVYCMGSFHVYFNFYTLFNAAFEVVDFLKNTTKYSRVGAVAPRGVLLEGPPGLVILNFVKMKYRVIRKGLVVVLLACYFHSKNDSFKK